MFVMSALKPSLLRLLTAHDAATHRQTDRQTDRQHAKHVCPSPTPRRHLDLAAQPQGRPTLQREHQPRRQPQNLRPKHKNSTRIPTRKAQIHPNERRPTPYQKVEVEVEVGSVRLSLLCCRLFTSCRFSSHASSCHTCAFRAVCRFNAPSCPP